MAEGRLLRETAGAFSGFTQMLQKNPAKNVFRLAGEHAIRGRTRLPRTSPYVQYDSALCRLRATTADALSSVFTRIFCNIWVKKRLGRVIKVGAGVSSLRVLPTLH